MISITETDEGDVFELGHAHRIRRLKSTEPRGKIVKPNGAIYIIKPSVLEAGSDWDHADLCYGYVMPRERSIDVDNMTDLEMCRALLQRQAREAETA